MPVKAAALLTRLVKKVIQTLRQCLGKIWFWAVFFLTIATAAMFQPRPTRRILSPEVHIATISLTVTWYFGSDFLQQKIYVFTVLPISINTEYE